MKGDSKEVSTNKKLLLIGLTGVGKSRFGNYLSGEKIFKESDETKLCTRGVKAIINRFGVEIIDSQGLEDTEKEDKEAIKAIFETIKNNRPNVIALVSNSANKRVGD